MSHDAQQLPNSLPRTRLPHVEAATPLQGVHREPNNSAGLTGPSARARDDAELDYYTTDFTD